MKRDKVPTCKVEKLTTIISINTNISNYFK